LHKKKTIGSRKKAGYANGFLLIFVSNADCAKNHGGSANAG